MKILKSFKFWPDGWQKVERQEITKLKQFILRETQREGTTKSVGFCFLET